MPLYRKRVLVDLDSTVADILTPWVAINNEEYGDDLTVDKITTWDMHEHAKKARHKTYEVLTRPGFFRNLPIYDGAAAALEKINADHDLYIVTAAEYGPSASEKLEWVKEHLPFVGKKHVVITHAKHLIKADVFVDDAPHNALAYRDAHPSAEIYGLWFPYNQMCPAFTTLFHGHYTPAKAWDQIAERLR